MKLQTPLSLTPEAVTMFHKRDRLNGGAIVPDAAISAMEGSMKAAAEEMQRVVAVAATRDPTVTVEAHALRVRDAALKAAERAAQRLDAAREAALADVARIQAETSAPPAPRDSVAMQIEIEIRSKLAGMDDKQRGEILAKAIRDGDDAIIGAALRGPSFLTGMGDADREMRRAAWRNARHPEAVDRELRLQKAVAAVDRGGKSMLAMVRQITETPAVQLAEAGKKRAEQALAALMPHQE